MISITRTILAFTLLAAAACGPSIPGHTGYPVNAKPPWNTPKRIILDERNQASVDGDISYPARNRARWFMVDLDKDGELKVTIKIDGAKDGTDVDVEVMDEGFNVIAQTDEEEIQEKATLELKNVKKGKTYFHVFARNKTDVADFDMKVAYTPTEVDKTKQFPYTVPMMAALAAVPPSDDAPVKKVVVKDKTDKKDDKKDKEDKVVDPKGKVRAKIAEYSDEGSGVRIVIDKGSDDGVDAGWTGYIVSKVTKKKVPGSDFTIKKAGPSESEASVSVSANDVETNRTVVLSKGSN